MCHQATGDTDEDRLRQRDVVQPRRPRHGHRLRVHVSGCIRRGHLRADPSEHSLPRPGAAHRSPSCSLSGCARARPPSSNSLARRTRSREVLQQRCDALRVPELGTCPAGSTSSRASGIRLATSPRVRDRHDRVVVAPDHQRADGQRRSSSGWIRVAARRPSGDRSAWNSATLAAAATGSRAASTREFEQVGVSQDRVALAHRRHQADHHPPARSHGAAQERRRARGWP